MPHSAPSSAPRKPIAPRSSIPFGSCCHHNGRPRLSEPPGEQLHQGHYTAEQIGFTGPPAEVVMQLNAADGGLQMIEQHSGGTTTALTFYKDDYVLVGDTGLRADFLRDADGRVTWLRLGGRLLRHVA